MAIPARITLVTIGVRDMAAMRSFYRGLGWPEVASSSDSFASFRTSGAVLALFPFAALAEDGRVPPGESTAGFRGVTFAINVESPNLVDSTIESVRQSGGRITKEPEDASWGGRSAYFADPEGNLWEVAWAPGTSFEDDGRFVWGE